MGWVQWQGAPWPVTDDEAALRVRVAAPANPRHHFRALPLGEHVRQWTQ